jgi:hypothetical protein
MDVEWDRRIAMTKQTIARTRSGAESRSGELSGNDLSAPESGTDWARLDAMTDEEALQNALDDPDSQPLTPEQRARLRRVPHP